MTPLAFLIDEDMAVTAASELREFRYDAVTVGEPGRKGSRDDAILWLATQQGRILITHNFNDYAMLHCAWRRWGVPGTHAGILVPRQRVLRDGRAIAERVRELAESGGSLENGLYTFELDGRWRYFDVRTAIADTAPGLQDSS